MAQDISKMNVQELKALAYDLTVQLGSVQQDLNTINQRIAQLVAEEENKKKEKADGTSGNKSQ